MTGEAEERNGPQPFTATERVGAVLAEVVVLAALFFWMRGNAGASTGGWPIPTLQPSRPPNAYELALHTRLTWSAVGFVVVAGALAVWWRSWKVLVVQVVVLVGVVLAAGALAP